MRKLQELQGVYQKISERRSVVAYFHDVMRNNLNEGVSAQEWLEARGVTSGLAATNIEGMEADPKGKGKGARS